MVVFDKNILSKFDALNYPKELNARNKTHKD